MTRIEFEHPLEDVHDFHKVRLPEHNEKMGKIKHNVAWQWPEISKWKLMTSLNMETGHRGNGNFYCERYCNLRSGNWVSRIQKPSSVELYIKRVVDVRLKSHLLGSGTSKRVEEPIKRGTSIIFFCDWHENDKLIRINARTLANSLFMSTPLWSTLMLFWHWFYRWLKVLLDYHLDQHKYIFTIKHFNTSISLIRVVRGRGLVLLVVHRWRLLRRIMLIESLFGLNRRTRDVSCVREVVMNGLNINLRWNSVDYSWLCRYCSVNDATSPPTIRYLKCQSPLKLP